MGAQPEESHRLQRARRVDAAAHCSGGVSDGAAFDHARLARRVTTIGGYQQAARLGAPQNLHR